MAKETILKLKKHFEELVNGKVKTGNPTRDTLIVSDAKTALENLKVKFPELFEEEKPKAKDKPKTEKKEE